MAVKTTLLIMLMSSCCVAVSFENDDSCFVETEVKAKVHCRVGINECNTVSLKRDFPHLFNQSYNSDDPEKVTVTPFCEARVGKATSYPGLEYQFRPPGHGGVTGIRGFEMRLEGGPPSMSDFKCTIFELEDNLMLEHTTVTFSSRFYPVARKMPYVVVFSSLPRKDDSYRNEKHVTSKSCVSNTQETSADWKPSYCNVSYDADSEILNVNFEAAPERFKFNQFNVIVTNLANFKHTHSHINQTEFSVPNIKPGEYEIRIEPYNPDRSNEKLCKCRNTDGRCDSCTEFIKRFTAKAIEVQKTAIVIEDNLNVSTVLIPVLCVLAGVVTVCIIIYLRKRGLKFHLHKAVVDANPGTKPTIIIIFDENSSSQRQIADKLKTLFSCVFGDNICLEVKTDSELLNKDKVDLKIHLSEPGASTAEIIQIAKVIQDNVEKMQDARERSQHENLIVRQTLIVFDAIPEKGMIPNDITYFHVTFDLPKLIHQLNSLVHLSQDDINKRMQTLDYKVIHDELDDFINNLKQESDNSETRLFVELPVGNGACRGEALNQNRCLSNNSEPDSGIRSEDEFESLNSSEETMNDNMQNYRRNEDWIRSMNSQGFVPDFGYLYRSMPYDNEQVPNLNWKSTKPVAGYKDNSETKVSRCPSEIQFFAPEPTEYSEYGEDVFFDEANYDHLVSLGYPVHNGSHKTYNHVPNSVAYHKVHSNGKKQNDRIHAPPTKHHRGRHRHEFNNSKEEHSSMESLMDKMADVNARYHNSIEHERVKDKQICPEIIISEG